MGKGLTTYQRGNHAVRRRHWRYIRYRDGSEELYDHRNDERERHNLASDPGFAEVKRELAGDLPRRDAPDAPVLEWPESEKRFTRRIEALLAESSANES